MQSRSQILHSMLLYCILQVEYTLPKQMPSCDLLTLLHVSRPLFVSLWVSDYKHTLARQWGANLCCGFASAVFSSEG